MTYTIAEPCIDVKDKACVEECPVDCIYEGPRMLYIHPEECIDCGACEPVCPVEAIFYEDDVPDEWEEFTPINAEFFEQTGLDYVSCSPFRVPIARLAAAQATIRDERSRRGRARR